MPLYKYRSYYKFNGPTRDEPFREELSPEEGKENIEDFFSEIELEFTPPDIETWFEKYLLSQYNK